jgi:hypothetical protein
LWPVLAEDHSSLPFEVQYRLDNYADGRYCLSSATKNPMLLPDVSICRAQQGHESSRIHHLQEQS